MLNDQILHSKDYFYVFCIYKYFWYKYGFRRVRFARVWSNVDDRNLFITAKLLKQGYRYHKIRKSLNETLNELENYAKYSGLKVNFAKTHAVWIGSKKYSTDSIKTKWKLNWGVNKFKLLGITFDTDLDKMLTLNFTDKKANIKTKINYRNCRSPTPIGRITVIKSLLISSLNHLFISRPSPNDKLLKDLNELFFNFIWTGTNRIKKTVLCQEYCNGGFEIVNINAFIAALKTTWLRKIITDNNSPWSIILQFMTDTKHVFNLGTNFLTVKILPKIKKTSFGEMYSHLIYK